MPDVVPREFREAPARLVMPQVRVGPDWLEPPPEVLPVLSRSQEHSVRLEIPIPANPLICCELAGS